MDNIIKEHCNFFGTQPHFYFQNKRTYKSKQGFIFTTFFGICVAIAFWNYGKELYFRENPQTTYSEATNNHPERFDIKKDTFNFAFGLADMNSKPFSDPQILNYTMTQNTIRSKKLDNGTIVRTFEKNNLVPKQCEKSDFEVDPDYFHNIFGLENYICMSNYTDAFIEGDFGIEVYAQIQGSLRPCKNGTESGIVCKNQTTIDKALADVYVSFFITDQVLNPQDFKNPFTTAGRNFYNFASSKSLSQVDIHYQNQYLEDNVGLIFDHFQTTRGLKFSNEKFFYKANASDTGEFFRFNIRMEKMKESRIYRNYLNFAQVAANIGGILKILLIFFATISGYISLKQYHLELSNEVFDFKHDGQNKNAGQNKKETKLLKFKNFMGQFFSWGQSEEEKKKQQLFQVSQKQLTQNLNIQNILKSMIDVEKLKLLLLDDQQHYLFDFLPKPVISEDNLKKIEQTNKKNKRREIKQENLERRDRKNTPGFSSQQDFAKIQVKQNDLQSPGTPMSNTREKNDQIKFNNVLLMEQQSEMLQKQLAYKSLRQIKQREKLSGIDQKLLRLVDKGLIKEAENDIESGREIEIGDITNLPPNKSSIFQNYASSNSVGISQVFNSQKQLIQKQVSNTITYNNNNNNNDNYNDNNANISKSGNRTGRANEYSNNFSFDDPPQYQQQQQQVEQQYQQQYQQYPSQNQLQQQYDYQNGIDSDRNILSRQELDVENQKKEENVQEILEESVTDNVDDYVIDSKRVQDSTVRSFFKQ